MAMLVVPFPRLRRQVRRRVETRRAPGEQELRALRKALRFVAVVLAVAVTATAQAVWFRPATPDPQLDRARQSVAAYERSRDASARNYSHPVYREALAMLDRVDPESTSADAADRMRARLSSRIRAFRVRQESRDRLLVERRRLRASRTPAP